MLDGGILRGDHEPDGHRLVEAQACFQGTRCLGLATALIGDVHQTPENIRRAFAFPPHIKAHNTQPEPARLTLAVADAAKPELLRPALTAARGSRQAEQRLGGLRLTGDEGFECADVIVLAGADELVEYPVRIDATAF